MLLIRTLKSLIETFLGFIAFWLFTLFILQGFYILQVFRNQTNGDTIKFIDLTLQKLYLLNFAKTIFKFIDFAKV